MTQDEIIEMADKADDLADAKIQMKGEFHPDWHRVRDEIFAKLVAAKEREKVARWQIGSGYTTGHGDNIEDLLVELEWQVREAEREACKKACEDERNDPDDQFKNYEDTHTDGWIDGCNSCISAIVARGKV